MTLSSSTEPSDDAPRMFIAGDFLYPAGEEQPLLGGKLEHRVDQSDLAVVNLEAPVDPRCSPVEKSGPAKESAAETPTVLHEAGIDAVTLANNHVMDYGEEGLRRTLSECTRAGLDTCGAGRDRSAALEPARMDLDGTSVALFSVCEQEFGIADADSPGTAWSSHPNVREHISAEADQSDVVVVVAHGGVEYVPFPPPQRQTQLRGFVEAGADLVVGHHPHVPQGWEVHQGTPIFYSLGNFRFDQPDRPKTSWGLALSLAFEDGNPTGIDLVPTELADGTVQEIDRERALDEHLQYLYRVTERTAPREKLVAHWQETAAQLFDQRYTGWLRRGTAARLRDQIFTPTQHASTDAAWGDSRRDEMLVLLNLFRNESHRATVETALALKTGDCEDKRTPEVREAVQELVEWTEDRPLYDRPSPPRAKLRALGTILKSYLPTRSKDSTLQTNSDSESA